MATVTLLHVEDCPSRDVIEADLRELARELGFHLERRQVSGREQAEALGFPGSPTVLVDGRDPFPSEAPPGLSCRLYPSGDGWQGAPPRAALRTVLGRAVRGA